MASSINPAKMQEAKRQKQQEREEAARRQAEIEAARKQQETLAAEERKRQREDQQREREAAAAERERQDAEAAEHRRQHADLTSLVSTTYGELDKLNRKNPHMLVTDLSLRMANEAINDVKRFVNNDPFLARITIFEPAGDLPHVCDVVLVLSQISAALERFGNKLPSPLPRTPEERVLRQFQR